MDNNKSFFNEKKNKSSNKLSSSSSFIFHNFKQQILLSFYSFNDKLIYQVNCSSDKILEGIIADFIKKKEIKEKIIKFLDITEDFNERNLTFYFKNQEQYEKIKNKKMTLNDLLDIIFGKNDLDFINISTGDLLTNYLNIYVKNESNKMKFKLPKDFDQFIINNTSLIAIPALNHHYYYLYNKNSKEFKKVKIPNEFKSFSGSSSYCNALNNLFIYEGEYDLNSSSGNFIKINLLNKEVKLISSKFPSRILHSMIFIPECYIFIIGGKNVKKTLIYTFKENNNDYEEYPQLLPYEILEPSLICINNKYLYAFENSSYIFHILRTDLINITPFEDIKIRNYKYDINQKFFAVVKNRNSIIFLGGQMPDLFNNSSKKCFSYDYNEETIKRSQKDFKPIEFLEKNFIPIDIGKYIQFREIQGKDGYYPQALIFQEQ